MADNGFDETSARLQEMNIDLKGVRDLADSVGRSLTNAFRGAVIDGKSLQGVLGDIGKALSDVTVQAALKPVGSLISGAVQSLFSALDPAAGGVTAFARGGVVTAPTYFPTSTGTALAGEAGPEAILPLSRGADGTLGLAGNNTAPVNVTFNVTATDARSFAASEAEISAMLLRAVKRGARSS